MNRDDALRTLQSFYRVRLTITVRRGRYGFLTHAATMGRTRDEVRATAQDLLTRTLDRLLDKLDAEPPP